MLLAVTFVLFQWAFGETAADLVRGRPHHLRVMTHFEEIIARRTVREIVLLQKPSLGGEHPKN